MENEEEIKPQFKDLGISQEILFALGKSGFINPTPIQNKTIPIALKDNDVVGIAQTGTGKTLAFGVPMLQKLINEDKSQGLVLLPTRELALQVEEMLQKIGRNFKLRTAVLIGGDSMGKQISALRRNPHIIIATPGRINDHLEQGLLSLKNVKIVVLDEADRMFDIGFAPIIKKILDKTPKDRQTLLFSATIPKEVTDMANKYMRTPFRIEIAPTGTSAEFVDQEIYIINKEKKGKLLENILKENHDKILVFVRTKHSAKIISRELKGIGHKVCELHSDRSLSQRKEALAGFKCNKYRILIATDIAARGIDVKDISLVINYDLPEDLTDYVHRIGRTGRAGKSGTAITFVTRAQEISVRRIEKLIHKNIKILQTPKLPNAEVYTLDNRDERPERREYNYRDNNEREEKFRSRSSNGMIGRSRNRFNSRGGFRRSPYKKSGSIRDNNKNHQ